MTDCSTLSLDALRAELDTIDDSILELIERRFAAAEAIGRAKARQSAGGLRIRPARQAAVVARLRKRARRTPPDAVAAIWRELMAHGVQAQARTELVLSGRRCALLEAQVRAHFGSAAPLSWAADAAEALRRAEAEEAIAIVSRPLPPLASGLLPFDTVRDVDGRALAVAVGRVAAADAAAAIEWSPAGWRSKQALQMPVWPDAGALAGVEEQLAAAPPLVPLAEAAELKVELARVAEGEAFLLQGGDCAESFAEFSPEKIRRDERLLRAMGSYVATAGGIEVVHVARAAGQFAKPRSALCETGPCGALPSYRGDAVNGRARSAVARTPDPERLAAAYRRARATLGLLAAYRTAGENEPRIHASHEALLLNYEQALTRRDEASGRWWAGSGHMVWIGERTRGLDGAHVEYARGIANPIGVKCGPGIGTDELLRLIDRLDPDNEPGRLVLIGRFGADGVGAALPPLMRAVRREGRRAIWSCDPMHGNTRTAGAYKTRRVADILSELSDFFAIAAAEGAHPGGIHLEMSGSDVTECIGGACGLGEADLPIRYLSHCDPRLNPSQAMDVAAAAARLIGGARRPRSNAA